MSTVEKQQTELDALRALPGCLNDDSNFARAVDELDAAQDITLEGLWGSSFAMVAAALKKQLASPLVVILAHDREIDSFCDDLALFTSEQPLRFPAADIFNSERVISDDEAGERLRTLKSLRAASNRMVVASIQGLLQPCPSNEELSKNTRRIAVGQTLDSDEFAKWLAAHRYQNTTAVELPGEFTIRGGLLDLFANDWMQPVRIERFGDEVESIRRFDIGTQRSIATLEAIEISIPSSSVPRDMLLSYLPDNSGMAFIELTQIQSEAKHYLERLEHPEVCHPWPNLFKAMQEFRCIGLANITLDTTDVAERLGIESVERFSGEIGKVRKELDRVASTSEVFIIAETNAEIERLNDILSSTRVAQENRVHYVEGRLSSGFRLLQPPTLVVSGNEMFHRAPLRRSPRRHLGKAIDSFLDLREGDLVVHLAHGIGRFRGLELINKDGQVEEHLHLEFHGGTKIFVPASRIELVQKYVGGRKARPRLATIGGKNWQKQKLAAEAAVQDLAVDLLKVQAERAARPGISFNITSDWQREFDASFPYTETVDQLHAVHAVRQDMSAARPMDRLICGDVGFGKTEIAMRAAFRAVDNGYQVAVLVPTTILAEQHFRTFRERMAEFPFCIAKLSRFCSPAEQRESISQLAAGEADIVIGTHRLASKDVTFQNLGLLIIDEEQRFGVEVKERLKSIRSLVDVLTLSATPIPRTLHMSLTGIRDISNLETPPEDRIAVETRVTRWSHDLIRNAVLRELNREGQIYFVHNRVNDIEQVKQKLGFIVPEATIGIGHGQMREGELERVMVDFVNKKFDILLATTIIESGLDIPNANTIFIDDANQYGLADLHQLRGRVGRYKHRAYCYLLVDPHRSLNPNAARRLRAIEEFSDMGAGFSIAMRDLEIRGAGNILGTQQSGHIALVGYELYCQLLETAVRRLQKLPVLANQDVNIELPGKAYIPNSYITDRRAKIDLYRRIARTMGDQPLGELETEMIDRFGDLPDPVQRMLDRAPS